MNDLSLDYINKKSPYLVKRADDGDYVFQTACFICVTPVTVVRRHVIGYSCDGLKRLLNQNDLQLRLQVL